MENAGKSSREENELERFHVQLICFCCRDTRSYVQRRVGLGIKPVGVFFRLKGVGCSGHGRVTLVFLWVVVSSQWV